MTIHKRRKIFVIPNTTANGIQIEYETFGERPSPPLLPIMGLSAQIKKIIQDSTAGFTKADTIK
jgi:hypothetical protein